MISLANTSVYLHPWYKIQKLCHDLQRRLVVWCPVFVVLMSSSTIPHNPAKSCRQTSNIWLYWRWSSLFNITDGSAECNGRFLSEVIVTQVQISHSLVPLHKQQPFTGHISNRIGGSKQTL